MSEYRKTECLFQYEKHLIAALEEMYGKGAVEVHEDAQHLYGYQGDRRSQKANIIIRRNYVGTASNDLGFVKEKDGSYSMIVSDYDRSTNFNSKKLATLTREYSRRCILHELPRGKYRVTQENGGNRIRLKVR